MTKVTDLHDLVRQVGEATGAVQSEINGIDAELRSLHAKRAELTDSPVTLDDVIDYLAQDLDRKADFYVAQMRKAIKNIPHSFSELEQGRIENFPIQSGDPYATEHTEAALIYIHRDAILAGYRKILEETAFFRESLEGVSTFPKEALKPAERREKIAEIDGYVGSLKERRAELVTALDKVGSKR